MATVMTLLLVSCGSSAAMSDDEVTACASISGEAGSLGGSDQLISVLVLGLPDDAIAPAGTPADEIEANFDRAFHEMYGIDVDQFLELRDAADEVTTQRLGAAPGVGELVSDEWFDVRDVTLLGLWNERFADSARAYCELITDDRRNTP